MLEKYNMEETENLRFLIRKNYDSVNENITNLELDEFTRNHTNNYKTNMNNTDSINHNSDDDVLFKRNKR